MSASLYVNKVLHYSPVYKFYALMRAKCQKGELSDTVGAAPNYTLRTLCTALSAAARKPSENAQRLLFFYFYVLYFIFFILRSVLPFQLQPGNPRKTPKDRFFKVG